MKRPEKATLLQATLSLSSVKNRPNHCPLTSADASSVSAGQNPLQTSQGAVVKSWLRGCGRHRCIFDPDCKPGVNGSQLKKRGGLKSEVVSESSPLKSDHQKGCE